MFTDGEYIKESFTKILSDFKNKGEMVQKIFIKILQSFFIKLQLTVISIKKDYLVQFYTNIDRTQIGLLVVHSSFYFRVGPQMQTALLLVVFSGCNR